MILTAVFLLSLSALTFEVLLTRVFSIGQWNHLSFMVISIALFGFAASGTYLSILDAKRAGWEKRLAATDSVALSVILYSTATIVSFITVNMLPLDYFRLPLEPVQSFYLFAAYLLFAVPFFCAGLMISVAYTALPEKTGYLYFASMTGSACGAVLPALFLRYIDEGTLIVAAAVVLVFMLTIAIIVKANFRASFRKLHRLKQTALMLSGISVLAVGIFLEGIQDQGFLLRIGKGRQRIPYLSAELDTLVFLLRRRRTFLDHQRVDLRSIVVLNRE